MYLFRSFSPVQQISALPLDLPCVLGQLSIEEYLLHPKHGRVNRLRLSNLQLAEFGVRSNRALVDLIKTHFRDFKLVRLMLLVMPCLSGPMPAAEHNRIQVASIHHAAVRLKETRQVPLGAPRAAHVHRKTWGDQHTYIYIYQAGRLTFNNSISGLL